VAVEGRLPNADVTVDSVGNLPNAARIIAQLHAGEKRLVFCDSRARVEELGASLRGAGVETYLSHSSLGVDERRRAEAAFTEGTNCVIVATSTLELGVDVGDLDRVIQIDAPFSVASFLQRLGRTGRRAGLERNALFLATDDESFLRACAIIRLWQEGYVEPIDPPAIPYHVLAQQLLALTLQEGRIGRRLWQEWLGAVPAFASMSGEVSVRVVDHLVAEGWLFDEQGLLSIGPEAERSLGWRHFTELTGIVATDPEIVVRYGQTEVGRVHPVSFRKDGQSGYSPILLGGRSWRATQIDWRRRVADVVPDPRPGRSRWHGDARALSGVLCRAVRSVLTGSPVPARLTRRGSEALERLREEFWWADNGATSVVRGAGGEKRWWTFAGLRANADLSDSLAELVRGTRSCDNLSIQLSDAATVPEIEAALRSRTGGGTVTGSSLHDLPKFAECLPRDLAALTVAERYADTASAEICLREPIQTASAVS
jgi:ATP-dependent Lhr-like helicase